MLKTSHRQRSVLMTTVPQLADVLQTVLTTTADVLARAVMCAVALSFTATIIVALAAHQAGRPDLIRSPKRVLAHLWEGVL
jgi:hypothetical protein